MPSMIVTTVGLCAITSRSSRASMAPAQPPLTLSPPTPEFWKVTLQPGKRVATYISTAWAYWPSWVMLSP